jgi:hypothetical protein
MLMMLSFEINNYIVKYFFVMELMFVGFFLNYKFTSVVCFWHMYNYERIYTQIVLSLTC